MTSATAPQVCEENDVHAIWILMAFVWLPIPVDGFYPKATAPRRHHAEGIFPDDQHLLWTERDKWEGNNFTVVFGE